jgi:hypothetical protein
MSNLKINREELQSLYMKEVDKICEACDWKTKFEPKEIIAIIANILETNSHLIDSLEYERGYERGYEAGLDAAYISNQSSGIVGDPQ